MERLKVRDRDEDVKEMRGGEERNNQCRHERAWLRWSV
jgi:hypothetical protein